MTNIKAISLLLVILTFIAACGEAGKDGATGASGKDGSNGINGTNGTDGKDGKDGADGTNGTNGTNGVDGINAQLSQFAITAIIYPCSNITTPYREILIQLQNGTIISSFSDNLQGDNTRLAILPPGSYLDTDNSGCIFTVHADGSVTW